MEPTHVDKLAFTGAQYDPFFKYWTGHKDNLLQPFRLELGNDPGEQSQSVDEIKITIPDEAARMLAHLSKGNEMAGFNCLLSALFILLYKYAGESLVVATPCCLPADEVKYNEAVPLCMRVEGTATIRALLNKTRLLLEDAYAYQNFPLPLVDPGIDGQRCFSNVMLHHMQLHEAVPYPGKYDLIITADDLLNNPQLRCRFNSAVFTVAAVGRLLMHLMNIIRGFNSLDTPVDALDYLSAEETDFLLHRVNDTRASFPESSTLIDLFESQAAAIPDATAVLFEDRSLTYANLRDDVHRIAEFLITRYQVRQGERVAVCMDRSEKMVAVLLAVFRCGAAYVPIDPDLPANRLRYLLDDAGVRVVVINDTVPGGIPEGLAVLSLQTSGEEIKQLSGDVLFARPRPDDIAYVIYTSGSTGMPKGVLMPHRGVVNRIHWMWKKYRFDAADIILQKTSYMFDVSVWELFMPLCFGATMVACRKEIISDPAKLQQCIKVYGVTTLHFVPGMLQPFLQSVEVGDTAALPSLKRVFASGEALLPAVVDLYYQKLAVPLHNLYGPTEAAVDVSFYETSPGDSIVPIGHPIDNIQLYILGKQGGLLPVGVPGELAIGGVGLAAGYLNRPELTAEKFVDHPFADGEKLYLTGDNCYRLANGSIVYLNRKDDQVKVRGFRIEPGEIESCLLRYPHVKKAAVLSKKDKYGDNTLYAFVEGEPELHTDDIYLFLQEQLPAYMVPAAIRKIGRFPLTTSGKTDRKALALLPVENAGGLTADMPVSETEKALIPIWEEVLSATATGRNDDFFRLGGDSIKAIRLVLAIKERLKCTLEVTDVFTHPVLSQLAAFIEAGDAYPARASDAAAQWMEAARAQLLKQQGAYRLPEGWEDCYPMSDIQIGMVFHNLMGDGRSFYHEQLYSQIVDDAFDMTAFRKALLLLARKHEALRTSFHIEGLDVPMQVVHKADTPEYGITFEELTVLDTAEQQRRIREDMKLDRDHPFDVTKPGLWRIRVYRLSETGYGILFVFHHGILDGWSNASFMTELSNVYSTCKNNRAPEALPPLASSYKDFVASQFNVSNDASCIDYWKKRLVGFERTPLPLKGGGAYHKSDYEVKRFSVFVDADHTAGSAVSLRERMLAAFYYLVWATTNAPEITVGVVTQARPEIPGGDKLLGCFLNTVPFRFSFTGKMTCRELVAAIVEKSRELKRYDKLSLKKIAKLYDDEQENPFFDMLFNYVDFHVYDGISKDITTDLPLIDSYESTNTYLDFNIEKKRGGINIVVTYADGIYTEADIRRLVTYFRNILAFMDLHPDASLSAEAILPAGERMELLKQSAGPVRPFPVSSTMALVFEAQVQATPEAVALVMEEEQLTYHELNQRANRIANYLLGKFNPQTDKPIALIATPSINAITGILAILKTGAPYLPLDPKYPQERVAFILEQAGVEVLLADNPSSLEIPAQVNTVNIHTITAELHAFDDHNTGRSTDPASLAYIIYTSGSTGVPKGVMVENRGVVNTAFAWGEACNMVAEDRVLQFATLSFDASCQEIFSTFAAGATLVLVRREVVNDPELFQDYMEQNEISLVTLPPTYLNTLDFKRLSAVRRVTSAGEAINTSDARRLVCHTTLYNCYGPTECSMACTGYKVRGDEPVIPIGRPMANFSMYILNNDLQLLPAGVKGQICIGGIGVSRGYLYNEALTAKRFVTHPHTGERLYLTGDTGVFNEEGAIICLGRNDDQIKINGYRIEISEIESVLIRHENITNVKVAMWEENGRKILVACLILARSMTEQAVRAYLSDFLPPYMIPHHFLFTDVFPYTINRKIDIGVLHRLYLESREQTTTTEDGVATETERMLQRKWEETFGRKGIGLHDSFFSLGGDSIKAIQLVALLRKEGLDLNVRQIFHYPSISMLAPLITMRQRTASQLPVTGPAPLTPMQLRFFRNADEEEKSFNFSFLMTAKEPLDAGWVKLAFEKLIAHHDVLRIRFRKGDKGVEQYHEDLPCSLTVPCYMANDTEEVYKRAKELHNSLCAFDWPLLKPALFTTTKSQHLLVVVSHLVTDVVSWQIILEDFTTLYQQLKQGDALRLPLKTASFREWAESLQTHAADGRFMQEFSYWKDVCQAGADNIAPDVEATSGKGSPAEKLSLTLDAERTGFLLTGSLAEQRVEPVDILLAGLGLSAHQVFGTNNLLVEMESHGRTGGPEAPDIVRTVGWFTSTYPLRIQVKQPTDAGREVSRISEARRRVPGNGAGYNVLRYLSPQKDTAAALDVPFQITFNYLGSFSRNDQDSFLSMDDAFDVKPSLKAFQTAGKDFDVVAFIAEGVLHLDICYNGGHFALPTMERWITAYRDQLSRLVDYYRLPGIAADHHISADAFERINKLFS